MCIFARIVRVWGCTGGGRLLFSKKNGRKKILQNIVWSVVSHYEFSCNVGKGGRTL